MDARLIRRLSYDGDYEHAILLLCDVIEKQEKEIKELKDKLEENNAL